MKAKDSPVEQLLKIRYEGLDFPAFCVLGTARLGIPLAALARQTVGLAAGDPRGDVSEPQCQAAVEWLVKMDWLDAEGRLTDYGVERFRQLVESLGYHWAMPFEFEEDDLE